MKKVMLVSISILMVLGFLTGCDMNDNGQGVASYSQLSYEEIANEIIRFHVVANSDSEKDQNLKLKVRDNVIKYISNELDDVKSIEDARDIIINNREEIENISKKVIEDSGYAYEVKTTLSRENFPDKYYGDLFFPQGEYEAFRILIGEASGQNWWCVMFPPLCFVDETMGAVNSENNKENFEKFSKNEVGNEKKNKKNPNDKKGIQFKLKFLEILRK